MTVETQDRPQIGSSFGQGQALDRRRESARDQESSNLPEANHTMPTQSEIAAQARLSDPLVGVHKQGSCSIEARLVEDGYAYRPYGSSEDVPYQWMRPADFHMQYDTFRQIDSGEIIDITRRANDAAAQWRARFQRLYDAAGKRSRRRFAKAVRDQITRQRGGNQSDPIDSNRNQIADIT